jgi:phytoene dehydrogenase-like protein
MERQNGTGQGTDVLIVGAGHNGLVAACYLARAGVDVLVVEAAATVGGMTATEPVIPEAPQHLFNEGAMDSSLFRATTIAADLELSRFGLQEAEVDPPYAYLDRDGASLCIWRDPRRTAEEIRRFSRKDAEAFLDLAGVLDAAMDVALPYMRSHPTRLDPAVLTSVLGMGRHPRRLARLTRFLTGSHAEVIEESFEHPMVRGPLAAVPCFMPITADGTGWALIYYGLIHRLGVGRFIGGTGALPKALARCLVAAGGRIRTSAAVEELIVDAGQVRGIRLESGEELHAKAVLAACNVKTTLTRLLPAGALPVRADARAQRIPTTSTSASSFKINVALRGRVDLPRHRAWRGDGLDLRRPAVCWNTFEEHVAAWDACARGVLPNPLPAFSILPTGADPSQAPEGQDTFWLWSGIAPVHPHEPWEVLGDRAAREAMTHVSAFYDGIEELEVGRQVMTPVDLAERFRVPDGNVYHVDAGLLRFGPLRPAAGMSGYRSPVPGLYLSGGGTHPSAGICGIPGQLAARVVARDLRGGRLLSRKHRRGDNAWQR